MTKLQTLENISTERILEVFNLSFSDYLVPFHLTKEQLENKIKSDSIKLEFSVGAFENNQLIAFVLHGYDIVDNLKVIYNAGTGVIPTKRGNRLINKLYEFVLPILHKANIDKVVLEVITLNERAIKVYTSIGFRTARQLNCFKGAISITDTVSNFEIRDLEVYDWQKLQSFWDLKPSWQNAITAVEKLKQSNVSIGLHEKGDLLGYMIYNPIMKRIHHLSVDKKHRKKGVALNMLKYISILYGENISIFNIEDSSKDMLKFIIDAGINAYVEQYEMELNLKSTER